MLSVVNVYAPTRRASDESSAMHHIPIDYIFEDLPAFLISAMLSLGLSIMENP